MSHLAAEHFELVTRRRLLARFCEYYENGFRDPELLYLGARYAISLRMDKEANWFLQSLTRMLCQDGEPSPAYAPIGLLHLQILPSDDPRRNTVINHLHKLSEHAPVLKELLNNLGFLSKSDPSPGSLQRIMLDIEQNTDGVGDKLLMLTQLAVETEPQKIQYFAKVATEAYVANELSQARHALEDILLLDGDQPDVLRNLVTVTSEQQDIEGYERYWRRYVKVLLWRIMRGDDADCAWDDLTRFYIKAANATDRELDKPMNEVTALLPRPGFLPRWLEAHAGLVWLESTTKSRREWQANLDSQRLSSGRQGHLALMRYWFHLFYPEFLPFLDLGQNVSMESIMPSAEAAICQPFNPSLKLVSRFLKWAKFSFALKAGEDGQIAQDRHTEAVAATAGCIARIPTEYYVKDLAKEALGDSQGSERKPLRLVIQEACSFPLSAFKLSAFLDAGDWAGLADFFDEPDMLDKLTPAIRMFLAFALCQTKREFQSLQMACDTLPDIPADALGESKQNYNLWRNILRANIGQALRSVELLEELVNQVREMVYEQMNLSEARSMVKDLPDGPVQMGFIKLQLLNQIDAAEKYLLVTSKRASPPGIEIPSVSGYPSLIEAWIDALKTKVMLIPDVGHLRALKQTALKKIENEYIQQTLVKEVIEKTQEFAQNGEFTQARQVIDRLPDDVKDLATLKEQLRSQIDAAEESARLNKQIEEAVEKSKKHVEKGQFDQARCVIRTLPDSPDQVKELKKQLLSQIDGVEKQAKEQAELQRRIDQAVKATQRYVQQGNFYRAHQTINALPDSPAGVKKLKGQLLSQIRDAEKQYHDLRYEITELEEKLHRRGISSEMISVLATANNVDESNLVQYYGLLRAIDQQL
jgi:hypothetical protein